MKTAWRRWDKEPRAEAREKGEAATLRDMAMKPNLDPFGAFINKLRLLPPPSSSPDQSPPRLQGLTFAVKDMCVSSSSSLLAASFIFRLTIFLLFSFISRFSYAVSDSRFDITGCATGFGNPDWARTHTAATFTAAAVLAVLEAGATCVGKTVMDELAYRLKAGIMLIFP